jgi:3-oxoacyl-[acyl-carrier-protein] synthase-3
MTPDIRITGLASYLPRHIVSNADLPALDPPQSIEEIDKVGIFGRGVADDDEDVAEMAIRASRAALEQAEVDPENLDFIVLANWTERRYVPDFAPRIQHRLGARRAFAFDICCACSGFVYGLSIAHGYLQNGRYQRGLVVASDRSTRLVRPRSRGTLVFGDGAGAAVVERGPGDGGRILDFELRTDGAFNDIMDVGPEGFLRSHIKQKDLNDLAGRTMAEISRSLLARNRLTLDDIDFIVPHSGTAGVQAMVARHLEIDPAKILTNLPQIGNVTTASIPAALRWFLDKGTIQPGHRLLSASVGLGWQYVAMLYSL